MSQGFSNYRVVLNSLDFLGYSKDEDNYSLLHLEK